MWGANSLIVWIANCPEPRHSLLWWLCNISANMKARYLAIANRQSKPKFHYLYVTGLSCRWFVFSLVCFVTGLSCHWFVYFHVDPHKQVFLQIRCNCSMLFVTDHWHFVLQNFLLHLTITKKRIPPLLGWRLLKCPPLMTTLKLNTKKLLNWIVTRILANI